MPTRNQQTTLKTGAVGQSALNSNEQMHLLKHQPVNGFCPKCKLEVPPKAGFRMSSLKCPKCGGSVVKK